MTIGRFAFPFAFVSLCVLCVLTRTRTAVLFLLSHFTHHILPTLP